MSEESGFLRKGISIAGLVDVLLFVACVLTVIGDLNTTSWSYYYKRFVSRMKLYDSRKGFGVHASWPTMLPILC